MSMAPLSCGPLRQHGATAVEFSVVALLFFMLMFGIMEFGRLFYVDNTLQEITRAAGRKQAVMWTTEAGNIKKTALFCPNCSGAAYLPAGNEVADSNLDIRYYHDYSDALAGNNNNITSYGAGSKSSDNLANCLKLNDPSCINFVRVTVQDSQNGGGKQTPASLRYAPMVGLFSFLNVALPRSTVILPAEAMGLL